MFRRCVDIAGEQQASETDMNSAGTDPLRPLDTEDMELNSFFADQKGSRTKLYLSTEENRQNSNHTGNVS